MDDLETMLNTWGYWQRAIKDWPLGHKKTTTIGRLSINRERQEIAEANTEHEKFSRKVNRSKKIRFKQLKNGTIILYPNFATCKEKHRISPAPLPENPDAQLMEKIILWLPVNLRSTLKVMYIDGIRSQTYGAKVIARLYPEMKEYKKGKEVARTTYQGWIKQAHSKLSLNIMIVQALMSKNACRAK